MNMLSLKFSALATLIAGCHALTFAAEPGKAPTSARDIAMYQGENRYERLVEAAKKEGEVAVYHSWAIRDMQPIFTAFTKKYGIKVKNWRASSEGVLQRATNEARGGRFDVDIVETNAPETEAMHREKLLQEVRSPYIKDLISDASPAHKEWVGAGIDVWFAVYNTTKVKKDELPKTYQDLTDPKWKGRLGIEANNHAWFGTLVEALGEQQGVKLFNDIIATNGISPRKGHSGLAGMVASGEVPLALTVYHYMSDELKQKSAPVDSFPLQPVIGQFGTVAMLKKAPNPNAAVLFYDFMLNEGQALLAERGFVPTSKKIESPASKLKIKFIDPGRALDMSDKWLKTWEDVVIKNAK